MFFVLWLLFFILFLGLLTEEIHVCVTVFQPFREE